MSDVDICVNLAHKRMLEDMSLTEDNVWQGEDSDAAYTEEAQTSFNKWYDFYWNNINNKGLCNV